MLRFIKNICVGGTPPNADNFFFGVELPQLLVGHIHFTPKYPAFSGRYGPLTRVGSFGWEVAAVSLESNFHINRLSNVPRWGMAGIPDVYQRLNVMGVVKEYVRSGTSREISTQFLPGFVSSIYKKVARKDSYGEGKKSCQAQEQQFGVSNSASGDTRQPKTRFRQWIGTVFGFGIIALFSGVRVGYRAERWHMRVFAGILVMCGFCCCWLTLMGAPYWTCIYQNDKGEHEKYSPYLGQFLIRDG